MYGTSESLDPRGGSWKLKITKLLKFFEIGKILKMCEKILLELRTFFRIWFNIVQREDLTYRATI